jgi:outer membrane immunogenic protein
MKRSLFGIAAIAALIGTPALAADMPLKAPPVPYYNWSGFYVGAEGGGGWATETVTHITGTASFPAGSVDPATSQSGALGGIYGGYNFQINHIVLGVDGDYTWSHLGGWTTDPSTVNTNVAHIASNVDWIATATGRIGYANNNWLLFAKAGGAWTGWSGTSYVNTATGALFASSVASSNRDGWTVGGGVEYGIGPHMSVKLEYDYVGLSTTNFASTTTTVSSGAVTTEQRSATSSLNMVKAGVDYRF